MSSAVANPLTSTATPSPATSTPASSLSALANPEVFLQLLVAQLKYQDPESPADGTQFVTQLAQFSQVGESTQMLSDLDAIKALLAALSSPTPNSAGISPVTAPATASTSPGKSTPTGTTSPGATGAAPATNNS